MTKRFLAALVMLFLCGVARADFRAFEAIPVDPVLEQQLAGIASEILRGFETAGLREGNLSITVIDVTNGVSSRRGSYAGRTTYHPASVVKMFYMIALFDLIEKGQLVMNAELERALRDMIIDSSNDATAYVLDRITGTTGGPELTGRAWRKFVWRRNRVNRYLAALGYDVNANGKTWGDGPYGREMQLIGKNREGRNRFTSDAFAAMMLWIAQRKAVSARASDSMLSLMRRTIPANDLSVRDTNVITYSGERLPAGAQLWTKPGFTSETHHDATYVELPNGKRYVLAVATRGASADDELLPVIGERVARLFEH